MNEVQRTPMRTPLPCFGRERQVADPTCLACQHYDECGVYMGIRKDRIRLSQATFNLVPTKLAPRIFHAESDPEAPMLGNVYIEAYMTVFKRRPPANDSPQRYRDEIVQNAAAAKSSIRLFILANMIAHQVQENLRLEHSDKMIAKKYVAAMLAGKQAVSRCVKYAEMCAKEFGSFNLTVLGTLTKSDFELNSVERAMLTSEVTAARFVIGHKMIRGGPPYAALYEHEELSLSPYWLATESTYRDTVLEPYRKDKTGSKMQQSHRFDVLHVLKSTARHVTEQVLLISARQRIMSDALRQVLSFFNHNPDDFEMEPTPVTNAMDFWIHLSRTLQHYETLLFYSGEPSRYSQRKSRTITFESSKQN